MSKAEKNRRHYLRHRDQIKVRMHAYYLANREKILKRVSERYQRIKHDETLFVEYLMKRQEYREKNAEKISAYQRSWRMCHKKRIRRNRRYYADRIRALCRNDETFYAVRRSRQRVFNMRYWRKKHPFTKAYCPRLSMRIPDHCRFDHVLDTRSVFLWNNHSANSLRGNRAYANMLYRERFGMEVR